MVKHFEFKGEKVPIRISYYALTNFKKETGTDWDELDKKEEKSQDLGVYEPLFFYGIESGHRAEGKEFKFVREDMFEIMEESFMEIIKLLPMFFPDEEELKAKKKVAPAVGNRAQKKMAKKVKA
jgi:hypothetical protein